MILESCAVTLLTIKYRLLRKSCADIEPTGLKFYREFQPFFLINAIVNVKFSKYSHSDLAFS